MKILSSPDALSAGHLDIVKYLIEEKGADIHERPQSILHEAVVGGNPDILKYLVDEKDVGDIHARNEEALRLAAAKGHLDIVKYLVDEKGADIHAGGEDAALHIAVQRGQKEIVQYLVEEKGVDIHEVNKTDLYWAAWKGHLEMVKYLVEQGADLYALGVEEALSEAESFNQLKVAQYLVEQGADISYLQNCKEVESKLSCLAQWQEVAPELAEYHNALAKDGLSPYPVKGNQATFQAAYDMLSHEDLNNNMRAPHAYHLTALFGNEQRILDYLENWGQGGKNPLCDIAHMIEVPGTITHDQWPDLKAWGDAVLEHGPEMGRLVGFCDRMQQPRRADDGHGWSLANTRAEAARHVYTRGGENPELALTCLNHGWLEEKFNDALAAIEAYQERAAQETAEAGQSTNTPIPDVEIDGQRFGNPDCVAYKLPEGDWRGLLLSERLGTELRKDTWDKFLAPYSCFYAIESRTIGEMEGQIWAWLGRIGEDDQQALVLDNLTGPLDDKRRALLCEALASELSRTAQEHNISELRIVSRGRNANLDFNYASRPARPLNPNCPQMDNSTPQYVVPVGTAAGADTPPRQAL